MYHWWIILTALTHASVNGQTLVGKVYVGTSVTDTTNLYSFNENYEFGLDVPVYVTVEDEEGNEVLPQENVLLNVTCELVTDGQTGYSQVVFNVSVDFVLESTGPNNSTNVPFSNMIAGRSTHVQCWGESDNSINTTVPVFTKQSSMANNKELEIRPVGTVSICHEVTLVSSNLNPGPHTMVVELSEDVLFGNVTITCDTSNTTGVVDTVDVVFDPLTISSGNRAEITYTVISVGENTLTAYCSAETIYNPGEIGNLQFDPQNSIGGSSQFVQDTGTVQLLPKLTQLRATQLTAYLILDERVVSNVEFVCRLEVTTDLERAKNISDSTECTELDINNPLPDFTTESVTKLSTEDFTSMDNVTVTDSLPGTTEVVPVNFTDGWNLRESVIQINAGSYYERIHIFREGQDIYAQPFKPEVVVVHCCAPDTVNSVVKYFNKSDSFIVAAYLSPNVTTNWDQATDPLNVDVETVVTEPQYVEVSPCPCDLTNHSCDINCCCDSVCTADDINTFNCIGGIEGGNEYNEIARDLCTAEYFNTPDWFPIMCVEFENSAFLGYFRHPTAALRSEEAVEIELSTYGPSYSFQVSQIKHTPPPKWCILAVVSRRPIVSPIPLEINGSIQGYVEGVSVKTGLPKKQILDTLHLGPNYRLALPGRSLSGECVFGDPVRFAQERSENCVWTMSENLCTAASPLNALNYALPSIGTEAICRKGLLVLKEQEVEEVGTADVNYLCAGSDSAFLTPYLRSTDRAADRLPDDKVKLFDADLPFGGEYCDFDIDTGAYVCPDLPTPTPPAGNPPRCDWDTGYEKAPTPVLDTSGDIPVCRNAVVEVYYNFTWKGPQVILLNATVVLADIPLLQERSENITITYQDGNETKTDTDTVVSNYTTLLTQLSNVDWNHEMNETLKADVKNDTEARTNGPYKRSGILGYELDSPVFSGIAIRNVTDGEFEYMDTNLTNQLALWKAGIDSLCDAAAREPVLFREDGMGSCLLRLGLEELKNCTYLRRLVLNQQDELMMSNYIGLGGDPDPTLLSDWLQVYREDISFIFGNDSDTMTTVEPTTQPTTEPATTQSFTTENGTVIEVTTVMDNSTAPPIRGNPYIDDLVGICSNIPSHINVDILYADAGKTNDIPIYHIVGAKIGYILNQWSLYCTATDGASCHSDTDWLEKVKGVQDKDYVQSFVVSSSVNFIEVSNRVPERQSKRSVSQSQNHFLCKYDTCWTEAFYPFTEGFRGDDYQYTLAVSLTSVVFLLGMFMISRPWW